LRHLLCRHLPGWFRLLLFNLLSKNRLMQRQNKH
jgi:hypothetical protein